MKKTISILMALLLMLSVLSVGATALTPSADWKHTPLQNADVIRYTPDATLPNSTAAPQVNRFASNDPNTPYTFYAQLPNALSRDIYNGMLNGNKPQAEHSITLSQPISVTATLEDRDGTTYLVTPEWFDNMFVEGIFAAASALMDDHPEMFWLGNFDVLDFDFTKESIVTGNSVTISVDTVLLTCSLPSGYANWNAVKTAYDKMIQVANGVQIAGQTRFEKVKSIHDWIAKRVAYDTDFGPTCFEATSVFLAPYKTVCEGYSEAFKMLCDRAGIPCIVVVGDAGEPHAWNYVKMEDGNWYAVDVTWDDQTEEDGSIFLCYDYFLRGEKSKNVFFDDLTFKASHTPQGDRYTDQNGNAIYRLTYPALATEGYTRMILAPNSEATVDKTKMTVCIPEGVDINDAFIILDGYKGYAPTDTPILQVTQLVGGREELVEEYQIVRPTIGSGDVNGDGKVNAIDARFILQSASGERILTAEQAACADVNGDGKINAIDARWILQIASGERTAA